MAFSGSTISDYAADTKRIGATKAWRLHKCSNWIKSWVRLLIINFLFQIQLDLHFKASHRCSDPCWGGVGNRSFLSIDDYSWEWQGFDDGDNEDDGCENAEDNKSNLQQCDLDEAADMTKSKTMLIVIMPLARTMCSLVILMRQSNSIAAAGIGSSVQSGAEEGGSLIKLELYLQPVPPPSLSSHRFWLHIVIVSWLQLVLHKETWISWILTTNAGQRGWLGPKNGSILILSTEYWHPAAGFAQENLAFSDSLTSG